MKYWLLFLVISSQAYANSSGLNLSLPSAPGTYSSDSFSTGDLKCSNAIGSATNLEFGVTGILTEEEDPFTGVGESTTDNVGVYARITIPLGNRPKQRINCNTLYELELRKKRLEVMRLEKELQQLRQLQLLED